MAADGPREGQGGGADLRYRIKGLADALTAACGKPVKVEWYGDPDHRSSRASFARSEGLGWWAAQDVGEGVRDIVAALEGRLERTPETITQDRYRALTGWHELIRQVETYAGILDPAASTSMARRSEARSIPATCRSACCTAESCAAP